MSKQNFTGKQRAFIIEFPKDFNATKSAERAGYAKKSARVSGHRCITNVNIWKAIEEEFTLRAMSLGEVLTRLTAQARGELPTSESDAPQGSTERYDTKAALELLGKYHKLFTDRIEIVDWREEIREAGGEPSKIFNEIVRQAVELQNDPPD